MTDESARHRGFGRIARPFGNSCSGIRNAVVDKKGASGRLIPRKSANALRLVNTSASFRNRVHSICYWITTG